MKDKPAGILVIKLGALGDFVQAAGPVRAIRNKHPKARITLMTTDPYRTLAEKMPAVDDVYIDARPGWNDLTGWWRLRRYLNKQGFDRVYDLQNSDRTGLYFRLFKQENRPEWVGAVKGASHRNDSPARTAGHPFEGHRQTLALAGIDDVEVDNLTWLDEDPEKFGLPARHALLVPGSSPAREEKRWPAESYGALAKRLSGKGITPVILGSKAENDLGRLIKQICPQACDLTGKTSFGDITALARGAILAVGNDTGPMHMIAATGCRCIVLFSEHSRPDKHKPLGPAVETLQKVPLAQLTVDDVWEGIRSCDSKT